MFIRKCSLIGRIYTRSSFRSIHCTASLQKWYLSENVNGAFKRSLKAHPAASSAIILGSALKSPTHSYGTAATSQNSKVTRDTENEIHVARMTLPDDGNPYSVVHGGVVLQIIEEAGYLCATKYCNNVPEKNKPDYQPVACAVVRLGRMMFHRSISIGEFVEAEAQVTFTGSHSLRVEVKVYAQNIFEGHRRLTNQATLWYVPLTLNDLQVAQGVPPMSYPSPEHEAEGLKAYQRQKKERENLLLDSTDIDYLQKGAEKHTVASSQTNMTQIILHSHCGPLNYCLGGSTMKWMDECAGVTAARHCIGPVVTLGLDAINFMKMSKLGDVLAITSRVIFTSDKTLEVECLVDILQPFAGSTERQRSIEAYFSFVSIDQNRRPQLVPPLKIINENEQLRFNRRQQVYEQRQKERKGRAKKKTTH